jgi:hypothetical protein
MKNITSQAEYDIHYPTVPLERWRNNVIDCARSIGDTEHQKKNWFHEDRPAWENPNELINALFDDSVFELFLVDCAYSLSSEQLVAGNELLTKLNSFNTQMPDPLDSLATFNDPRWQEIAIGARHFVASFDLR